MYNSIQGQKMLEELEAELSTSPSSWVYWLGSTEVVQRGHLEPRKDVAPHYLMTVIDTYRMVVSSFAERSSWHKNQTRASYEGLNKAYQSLADATPYIQMKSIEESPHEQIPFDLPTVT